MNKKEHEIISRTAIFKGIDQEKIGTIMKTLNSSVKSYGKNQEIIEWGTSIDSIRILLDGEAIIIKEDFWGNRNIIAQLMVGDVFGETYALVKGSKTGVAVICQGNCKVLNIPVGNLIELGEETKEGYAMMSNLLRVLSFKNLLMNEKLTHMSQRSIRDKVISYLDMEMKKQGHKNFDIPFNRQEMADYLSVDRSALSSTLSKLRDEGVIEFKGKHFTVIL